MTLGHLRTLQLCGRLRVRGHVLKADLRAAEWEAVDAVKVEAEAALQSEVAAVLQRALEAAADRLAPASKADEVLTTQVFDLDEVLGDLLALLGPAVTEAVRAGFAAGSLRIEQRLTFDATRPSVQRAVADLLEKAEGVPLTLRSRLDTIIRDGLARDLTRAQLAGAVYEAAGTMAASQAEAIAQTTGTGAFEAGQLESFRGGGVEAKGWLSQRDGNVRPEHDEADGQEVGIDEAFDVGGEALMYPADPAGSPGNIIRCRCTSSPIIRLDEPPGVEAGKAVSDRDAWIVAEYGPRVAAKGRGVALAEMEEEIAERAKTDGWSPIGQRQIRRIGAAR